MTLVAPFPYFGGKRMVAAEVWRRFGAVRNYIEPFAGSAAVLLARPAPWSGIETINDLDGFVANFWRAVRADPEAVADWADWPVNECDLEARHYWLVTKGAARLAGLLGDPGGYCPQVAGWWAWGACAWIGAGWCAGDGSWWWDGRQWHRRHETGCGVARQLPHLAAGGRGLNQSIPPGTGARRDFIMGWFAALAERLRDVRVACGDWCRVVSRTMVDQSSVGLSPCAVFLDPPYGRAKRHGRIYRHDDDVADAVVAWAFAHGDDPQLRIALCGYDGTHSPPPGWTAHRWRAKGGYGNQGTGRGRDNANREVVWFSPGCLPPAVREGIIP